jgi:hypothetical protein
MDEALRTQTDKINEVIKRLSYFQGGKSLFNDVELVDKAQLCASTRLVTS